MRRLLGFFHFPHRTAYDLPPRPYHSIHTTRESLPTTRRRHATTSFDSLNTCDFWDYCRLLERRAHFGRHIQRWRWTGFVGHYWQLHLPTSLEAGDESRKRLYGAIYGWMKQSRREVRLARFLLPFKSWSFFSVASHMSALWWSEKAKDRCGLEIR